MRRTDDAPKGSQVEHAKNYIDLLVGMDSIDVEYVIVLRLI